MMDLKLFHEIKILCAYEVSCELCICIHEHMTKIEEVLQEELYGQFRNEEMNDVYITANDAIEELQKMLDMMLLIKRGTAQKHMKE